MLRGERLGIAGGLGEPDQQQGEGRDDDRGQVPRHQLERRQLRDRQAAWHGADQRHAALTEVEQHGREQAADDEHERAGHLRQPEAQPEDDGERDEADEQSRWR